MHQTGMSNSIMRDKAKDFAKKIVFLCREMKSEHKEAALINQLLRSGTSIGANTHEAQYAQGTKDFISKFEVELLDEEVVKVIEGSYVLENKLDIHYKNVNNFLDIYNDLFGFEVIE